MVYILYRIPLCAPPTMTMADPNSTAFHREGFILSLSLEDGCEGFGEVSTRLKYPLQYMF